MPCHHWNDLRREATDLLTDRPSSPSIAAGYIEKLPGGSDGKESACNAGDLGSVPELGRSPGKKDRLPTPVFLPGESHEQRTLPWQAIV